MVLAASAGPDGNASRRGSDGHFCGGDPGRAERQGGRASGRDCGRSPAVVHVDLKTAGSPVERHVEPDDSDPGIHCTVYHLL